MSDQPAIATDPNGVVHQLDGHLTKCGQNADGWSRAITLPYLSGLYVGCEQCYE